MPALQSGNYNLLDRSNGQGPASSTSTPPNAPSPAPLKLVGDDFVPREALQSAGPDGFAARQGLVDSSTLPGKDADGYSEYDDRHTDCTVTGSTELARSRFLDRPGAAPCNLTTRLANRSNGPPLETIVEHHSRSTLNSRLSLLSLARLAALQESEIAQTNTADSQIRDAEHTSGDQRVSSFLRNVLHTVQDTSRARPWSSPLIQTATVTSRKKRAEPTQRSQRSHQYDSDASQTICAGLSTPRMSNGSTSALSPTPPEHCQTRSRQTSSSADVKLSARADLPFLTGLTHGSDFINDPSPVPHLLSPSVATRSRERFTSVHPVQPKPREGAHNSGTAEVPALLSERRSDTPVQNTLQSVSVYPGNAPLLAQCDCAIEASRNASFCSTLSTSYSGTVLGVDLDLAPELIGVQNLRRSCSPTPVAPPVWFTPQMAELERQASMSESPEQTLNDRPNTTSHSIKSFALPSLLPIAAASGIITPNYSTPKISFYSPSGNLIQPESNSSPGTSSLEISGSPTLKASYYYSIRSTPIHQAPPATTCSPPVRPALVPMTTPPIFSAPMPAHLRHHHNYRHPEMSQIEFTGSFVLPTPAVRGCGGMVKSPSFTPRSGTWQQHNKSKSGSFHGHHRSIGSIVRNLRFEARFYKARLITRACTSCGPSGKGKVLRKRHMVNRGAEGGSSSHQKNNASSAATTVVVEEKARISSTSHKHDDSTLGPLAAHTLRICFCQPYDGAGRLTNNVAADAPCISNSRSASDGVDQAKRDRERVNEPDSELPNARVVSKKTDSTDKGDKKAAIGRIGTRARPRSDSVVSVGVGLRVATVGA